MRIQFNGRAAVSKTVDEGSTPSVRTICSVAQSAERRNASLSQVTGSNPVGVLKKQEMEVRCKPQKISKQKSNKQRQIFARMVSLLIHHQMLLKGYFRVQFPSEACCYFLSFFRFSLIIKILPDSLKELATCGCSSTARTSVFQTGYVSSILITRSKIYSYNPSVNKRQAYLGFPFLTQIRKTNATYFWD